MTPDTTPFLLDIEQIATALAYLVLAVVWASVAAIRKGIKEVALAALAVVFVIYVVCVFIAVIAVTIIPMVFAVVAFATWGGITGWVAVTASVLHGAVMVEYVGVMKLTERILDATLRGLGFKCCPNP